MMDPMSLSPDDFEQEVRRILTEEGVGLKDFTTSHLEKIYGTDGDYIFDVTARFEALGANFLVLIECKRQVDPIEREIVQILAAKLRAVAAQKGMIFSTAPFRRGAIRYAQAHHIALVLIADGKMTYVTKDAGPVSCYPPWIPRVVGLLVSLTDEENESYSTLGAIGPLEWEPESEGFLRDYLSG
jgi:restriction system protein